ncbi:MAG: DUF1028 domain-containing protein [Planctomycetota bacterium]
MTRQHELLSLRLIPLVLAIGTLTYTAGNSGSLIEKKINTFSIVALDSESGAIGIGVASKYLAVGSAVPWAKANIGGTATQSYVNTNLGIDSLVLLAQGKSPEQAIRILLDADPGKEMRQVGIVDHKGNAFAFTGSRCLAWAGSKQGKGYTVQGNLLAGPEVLEEMCAAFEAKKGSFPKRIFEALLAGEKAGGDKRGKQSAAILIVREKGGPNKLGDREIDLRVDDHPNPLLELGRLLQLKGVVMKPEK